MRFFSKLVFICNICFLIALIIRFVRGAGKDYVNPNDALILRPLESTVVVLGYGAILLNFVFVCLMAYFFLTQLTNKISRFIIFFNIMLLLFQVYYFFFSEM